jgi:hypothetical protein
MASALFEMVFHGLPAQSEESGGKRRTSAYVSSLIEPARNIANPREDKMAGGEILLLCSTVISLLASCILWSPHKQVWMDEIFTWKEVSDPSLWHLYYAIQHGADGGQPLFYTTAWIWARTFGFGVLGLRLYSCVSICAALVVTWVTIRRFYGVWATAFGVLAFWGTSGTLLDQNVEARFYGLYMLCVAITVNLHSRLVARPVPTRLLLLLALLSQAALVLTHVLGLIYSGLILLALISVDGSKGRLRGKLYLAYAAGWLALLTWVPAIRSSMAAGKPHGWIAMPTITDLRTAYLFADSLPWLRFFKRYSSELGFQIVSRTAEFVIYVPLVVVFLFGLRRILRSGWRSISDPKNALLLLAYILLSAPVVLFVLSHLVTPVFVPRYFMPSGIGLAIVLTASADALGADRRVDSRLSRRPIWGAIVLFLMISPLLTVLALGPINLSWDYLNVQLVEQYVPPSVPVVAGWQEDFVKLMRLSHNPEARYYYLLDWPSALAGPRSFVLDYHLMQAYRNNGYYAGNIVDSHDFLCSRSDFFVLDAPNANTLDATRRASPDMQKPNWFDMNVRSTPQFKWRVVASFEAPEVARKLIAVHRNAPLSFCNRFGTSEKIR